MSGLSRSTSHSWKQYAAGLTSFAAFLVWPGTAQADAFSSYQYAGSFQLPAGSGPLDVLGDGRVITLSGHEVYVETAAGSHSFTLHGTLSSADLPSFGAAFIRVSPDGTRIAVGNNGGASFSNYQVGVFSLSPLSGTWFSAAHFDGEWIDNTHVALTAGDFVNPSFVTALDTSSPNPLIPVNPTIVSNIGGASGGIAFDSAGNLYTGNGFQSSGPSGTGAVKAISLVDWSAAQSGGPAVDFENDGVLVVDILSASPIGLDDEGHLFVGGGDFSSSTDVDFVALVRNTAIAEALAGMGPANPSDAGEVRQLDPDLANQSNFFSANFNSPLRRLYVYEGQGVHVYQDVSAIPTVSQWGLVQMSLLLATLGTIVVRRRMGNG